MKIAKLKGNYLIWEVLNACGAHRIEALQEATLESVSKYNGFAYKIVHPEKQEQIDELFEKAKLFLENQVDENVVLSLMDLATLCLVGRDWYLELDAHKVIRNAYLSIAGEKLFKGEFSNYQKMREEAKWMGKIAEQLEVIDSMINPLKNRFEKLSIEEFEENFSIQYEEYALITMDNYSCLLQYFGKDDLQTYQFANLSGVDIEENLPIDIHHVASLVNGNDKEELIVTYLNSQRNATVVKIDLYTGNNKDTGELLSEELRVLIEKYLDNTIDYCKEIMEEMKK